MPKLVQHINILNTTITGANDDNQIVYLDTTKYSGTVTYYFEIVASIAAGSENVTLRRKGTTTDDATIPVTGSTSKVRFRSAAFTPLAGGVEYIVHCASTAASVSAARIIIVQEDATAITSTETQIDLGNEELGLVNTSMALLSFPKFVKIDTSKFDGTVTMYVDVVWTSSSNSSTTSFDLWSDDGADSLSFSFYQNLLIAGTPTAVNVPQRSRFSFTPPTGFNFAFLTARSSNMANHSIYGVKIIIQQTSVTAVTKVETHHLMANTGNFGGSTGLKNTDILFDPNEWDDGDGSTIRYLEVCGANAGTADIKLQSDPNGTPVDITGSTITDAIRRERSSALTMPGSAQTLDVNVTGTGTLNSAVLISQWTYALVTAAITGTVTTATEANIVSGGKTIIITLTGSTWVAAGATFDAQRQNIINGLVSAQAEANGWNTRVKPNLAVTTVVRNSNTQVTITLSAQALYDITANETITVTIPGTAIASGGAVVGNPTFDITATASASVKRMGLLGVG